MATRPTIRRFVLHAALLVSVLVVSALVALAGPRGSAAQTLDPGSADALVAVLRLLLDPASRNAALAGDPRASGLDTQMRSLAGSEAGLQEFYALAAEVFEELTRNAGGDAGKMSATLQQAMTEPAAFAGRLSPRLQQRLRELAAKLSDRPR